MWFFSPEFFQGLGPNLAYFTLRFGEAAICDPDAPSVFVDGNLVSLAEHCATHINADAMRTSACVVFFKIFSRVCCDQKKNRGRARLILPKSSMVLLIMSQVSIYNWITTCVFVTVEKASIYNWITTCVFVTVEKALCYYVIR